MKLKYFLSVLFCTIGVLTFAQQNFTYEPANPQPGDIITITYIPAGALANTLKKVEAVAYINNSKTRIADDLPLIKKGKNYIATIKTDTAANFIQLGFYVGQDFDNNFNEGYFIQLKRGGKIRDGSFYSLARFYQYYAPTTGVEGNSEKALKAMEDEMAAYPQSKWNSLDFYYLLIAKLKKDQLSTLLQRDIEQMLKSGLKSEKDYERMETLYALAKLPEQSKFMKELKKKNIPDGNWQLQEAITKLEGESDSDKKVDMAREIMKKVESNKKWQTYNIDFCYTLIFNSYLKNKQWTTAIEEFNKSKRKMDFASVLNSFAWSMQEKNEDLNKAEELAALGTETAKNEINNPSKPKPDYFTTKLWNRQRETTYGSYADTYAMVLFKKGDYAKGFSFAKEAAIKIGNGKNSGLNDTYAILAEKTLSPRECKKDLEQFVREGKASSTVKDVLKRIYVVENKSEEGFDKYMVALAKEAYLKMVEDLRKSMINKKSPSFALKNLKGELVNLESLKGKVVVLDFWATWCGPCKASFPALQKVVTKYQNNPDIQFLFVDSWEVGDDKEKLAADFIAKNKYSFNVLMDVNSSTIGLFGVNGIPAKFILDKTGQIQFSSLGFDGDEEKLFNEMEVMIALCENPAKVF